MTRFYVFAISVLLISCNDGKNKPDVSNIKIDLRIERFEQSFFKIDTNKVAEGLVHLRNAHPAFYPVFMQNIIGVNPIDTGSFPILKNIIGSYRRINDTIQTKYNNLGWLKTDLTDGFRYVKHYYPNYKVPAIITYISTLDAPGIVMTPEHLGIGLQQFGGKNFTAYQSAEIQQMYPSYISRRFDKEYIVPSAMKAVVDDVYPDRSTARPLIEQMIEKGKHWFLLDHFLPDAPDTIKTGYTKKQIDWVNKNEGNMWAYIAKNENLYSVEPPTIQTYIGEAPFTQGMPESSPGNIGQWIGWRIVQQYADRNKELSVQQVLQVEPSLFLRKRSIDRSSLTPGKTTALAPNCTLFSIPFIQQFERTDFEVSTKRDI
jgi:hypothetical protein